MSDPVSEAAAELYGLPPDEFVTVRAERVKQLRKDGDAEAAKQVAALRKPTVGAWLVNLLVADEPGLTEQVTALADQLRTAQEQLSGEDLRALGRQRQELVSGLVARARGLARDAGRKVTGSVLDTEVESSLRAALADPDVAQDVLSGRLTRATEFTGFGPAPTSTAPSSKTKAAPSTKKKAKAEPPGKQQTAAERKQAEKAQRARERLQEAEEAFEAAQAERTAAQAEASAATEQLASERERMDALRAQVDQAQAALDQAAEADEQARWRARRAAAAMKAAEAAVTRARDAADRLER